jgi:hypothetical protein
MLFGFDFFLSVFFSTNIIIIKSPFGFGLEDVIRIQKGEFILIITFNIEIREDLVVYVIGFGVCS